MNVLFNGENRTVSDGSTVADLLATFGFEPRRVAVEVNLEIVPRDQQAEHVLREGDRLEVVTLVGGG